MKHTSEKELTATIDRREGRFFVLTFPDKQELLVPIHCFTKKTKEGDIIHLRFLTDKEATADKTELAKHLLEEILNGG